MICLDCPSRAVPILCLMRDLNGINTDGKSLSCTYRRVGPSACEQSGCHKTGGIGRGSHTCRKGWFLQRSEESVPVRLSLSRKRRNSTAESSADTRCDRLFHIPSAPAVQQRTDQTAGCWKRHRAPFDDSKGADGGH